MPLDFTPGDPHIPHIESTPEQMQPQPYPEFVDITNVSLHEVWERREEVMRCQTFEELARLWLAPSAEPPFAEVSSRPAVPSTEIAPAPVASTESRLQEHVDALVDEFRRFKSAVIEAILKGNKHDLAQAVEDEAFAAINEASDPAERPFGDADMLGGSFDILLSDSDNVQPVPHGAAPPAQTAPGTIPVPIRGQQSAKAILKKFTRRHG